MCIDRKREAMVNRYSPEPAGISRKEWTMSTHAPLTARDIHGPYVQLLTNLQGENGHEWLEALKKFNRKENPWKEKEKERNRKRSRWSIFVDRSQPFDPVAFLGKGWSIVEEDERSLALTEINLRSVKLERVTGTNGKEVSGEERLQHLKTNNVIRLDAAVFQVVWENQYLIPERWKEVPYRSTSNESNYVSFDGTRLRSPNGEICVLQMFWSEFWHDCKWDMTHISIKDVSNFYTTSAVLRVA